MDIQTIIVFIIILIAFGYVGKIIISKMKSFSDNSNCGRDCGCDFKKQK